MTFVAGAVEFSSAPTDAVDPPKMRYATVIVLVVAALVIAKVSPSADKDAVVLASFKHMVDSIAKENTALLPPFLLADDDGLWRKCQFFTSAFAYDVERTESLVSPYLGTMTFEVHMMCSCRNYYKSDAEADTSMLCPAAPNGGITTWYHLHKYAYQEETWVSKSAQCRLGADGAWIDCPRDSVGGCKAIRNVVH